MKKIQNNRRMRNTFSVVLSIGFMIFCLMVIFTFSRIHKQVDEITMIAMKEYRLNAIESLTNLIKSENHSFKDKNSAIWALGQFADQEALPFLEGLYIQTEEKGPCSRNNELCKYEIEKAIKWCKQGNLTSWMYRNIEKQ